MATAKTTAKKLANGQAKPSAASRTKKSGAALVDLVPRVLMPFRRGDMTGWMITARHVPLGVAELLALLDDARVVERAPTRLELPAKRTVPKARGGWEVGDAGAAALAEVSALAGFTELAVPGGGIGPDGVRALGASPHLKQLRRLDLSDNPLGDDGLEALASAGFQGLEELELATGESRTEAGAKGLAALVRAFPQLLRLSLAGHRVAPHAGMLASAAFAGTLRELSLRSTGVFSEAAADELGRGRLGDALTSLDLAATEVGPEALTALVRGSWPALRRFAWVGMPMHRVEPTAVLGELARLPALAELRLVDALLRGGLAPLLETDLPERLEVVDRLGASGETAAAVFARPWPKLRELDLAWADAGLRHARLPALEVLRAGGLGIEGAEALAAAHAPQLRKVRLMQGAVGGRGLAVLLGALPALERFELATDTIDTPSLGELRTAASVSTLRSLHVSLAGIDAAAVEALLRPGWPALQDLAFDGNPAIGLDGLRAVLSSPVVPRLLALDLSDTGLEGAEPMQALSTAPLGRLRSLALRRTSMGDEGASALATATGLGDLRFLDLRRATLTATGAAAIATSEALGSLEELQLGENAPVKGTIVEAPPHRIVGQGRATRADLGLDRADARYY